jgi:hypothetical protein
MHDDVNETENAVDDDPRVCKPAGLGWFQTRCMSASLALWIESSSQYSAIAIFVEETWERVEISTRDGRLSVKALSRRLNDGPHSTDRTSAIVVARLLLAAIRLQTLDLYVPGCHLCPDMFGHFSFHAS